MSILDDFIIEYKKRFLEKTPIFDESLNGKLQKLKHTLLDDKLSPSIQLNQALVKLEARVKEPMKVAVTGQFSSGKSTFLNALLAKNILPTGITPVTSKVNYIRYGDELKIRVRYKDGRDEYHDIKSIKKFTDQRQSVEDIEFLTLYSPLNMLKDIVFVDTPGLNSQALSDTETTIKVLREVDGIIWLTLIDNAGKMSEERVLKKYLNQYKSKSLCVLNQKDKFSDEEVKETLKYVKKSFGEFFSEIIPISATQALLSRSSNKEILMQEALEEFLNSLHVKISENLQEDNLIYLQKEYENFKTKLQKILNTDISKNLELAKQSNIDKVIDFIKKEIQPKAINAKEFSIKKEMKSICQTILFQYKLFEGIYNELEEKIEEFKKRYDEDFSKLKEQFRDELKIGYMEIEKIIRDIATEIYSNIQTSKRERFAPKKRTLLVKEELFTKIEYEISYIDSDNIYKRLFWDDDLVGKMFKRYIKEINEIKRKVNDKNRELYEDFESEILKWQNLYSIIRKKDSIHSDIEFANVRKFASRVYENILKEYNDEILKSFAIVNAEFDSLISAIKFNYQNATGVTISFFNDKIEKSAQLYEENPTKFALYKPTLEEIKTKLQEYFYMYELENKMNSNRAFLTKEYDRLKERFDIIKDKKIAFIESSKRRHLRNISLLKDTLKEID